MFKRIPLEEYFELTKVQDAHNHRRCRDLNGEEWRACSSCHCTEKFEARLAERGQSFLEVLSEEVIAKDR